MTGAQLPNLGTRPPVIGILTAGRGPIPGNRQMFRYVLQACREVGMIAYVFLPGQINWAQRVVDGYQWRHGRFVFGSFPLPDVVYNRVPNRRLEVSPAVMALKRQLRQHRIPFFNPRYLNKLDLHRILSCEPKAVAYLPWAGRMRSMADLDRALQRFGDVYLKPKDAFAGKGILRVSRSDGHYSLRMRVQNVNRKQSLASLSEVHERVRTLTGGKTYMIQQAIDLARFRGRIFDVRLLAQRNRSGTWQVSGMGVRVASVGGITTHVPNGGFIASVEEVLPAVFHERAQEIERSVRELALVMAPLVEKGCRARFGEMSMDVGIRPDGRPFFFEANAKPMKFDEDRIRQAGLANLVGYMQYLAALKGVTV